MKLLKLFFIALIMPFTSISGWAQTIDKLDLSLEQALEMVHEKAVDVLIAEETKLAAKAAYSQGNAVFLPQLSIEETGVKTNDPIGVFGIKLRQGIITPADFNPSVMNSPDALHSFTTKFQVLQPIINADGFYERKSAKHQFQSASEQAKATKEFVKLKVKELYYQLAILDKQTVVQQSFLESSKAHEEQAKNYFEQGVINKSEYLRAKVETLNAEQALLGAQNKRASINDALLLVLGINENHIIQVLDNLEFKEISMNSLPTTLGSNSSLNALEYQMKASSALLKAARFSFLPSLNAFGSYELHDSRIFGNKSNNYTFGATLRWDIFKGYKQAGMVTQRKAELRKTELVYENSLNKYQVDVRNARRSINLALQSMELAKLKTLQTDEDVRIRTDRYSQGIEKTTDLLMAESTKLASQLNLLQAEYQYFVSVAQLEYLFETEL